MAERIDEFGQEIGLGSRKAPRQSVLFLAAIARPGGPVLGQVKVRNISASGLMAETGIPFRPGEAVEIELRGIGTITGTIARRTANQIGIKFDLEIDPDLTRKKV